MDMNNSMSPVLSENTSITTFDGRVRLGHVDKSLEAEVGGFSVSKDLSDGASQSANEQQSQTPKGGSRTRRQQSQTPKGGSRTRQQQSQTPKEGSRTRQQQSQTPKGDSSTRRRTNLSTSQSFNRSLNSVDDSVESAIGKIKESCLTKRQRSLSKRKSADLEFNVALESSVETDISVMINQKESLFHKRARAKKSSNINELENALNSSFDSVLMSPNLKDKRNPFDLALESDSSEASMSKLLDYSRSAARPENRKRSFVTRNSNRPIKSKTIKDSEKNKFEAALETSNDTDISIVINNHLKSRLRRHSKKSNKSYDEAFQKALDSSTDVSDIHDVQQIENVVSKGEVCDTNLSNNCGEENDMAVTDDIIKSPNRVLQNAEVGLDSEETNKNVSNNKDHNSINCDLDGKDSNKSCERNRSKDQILNESKSTDEKPTNVKRSNDENSNLECDVTSNGNKDNSSNISKSLSVPLDTQSIRSFCSNSVNKTKKSVLSVAESTIPDVILPSSTLPVITIQQSSAIGKQGLDMPQSSPNSLNLNGSSEGQSRSQPSVVLHLESDYDSMLSSSESEDEENSTQASVNDNESSNVNCTKEKSVLGNNESAVHNEVLQRTSYHSLNRLDVSCISNRSRSSVRRRNNESNSPRNEVSVRNEISVLSMSMANEIVRVNENFDSMDLTNSSVSFEQNGITNVTAPYKKISVTMNREPRLSVLSPLKSHAITMVDNDSKRSENLNISVDQTEGNGDVAVNKTRSPRLASLRKRTSKGLDTPVTLATPRKRLSKRSQDKSQIEETSHLSVTRSSLRKRSPKNSSGSSNVDTLSNSINGVGKMNSSYSLRKRILIESQNKSNKENSLYTNPGEVTNDSFNENSIAHSDGGSKSHNRQSSYNDKSISLHRTSSFNDATNIISAEIPLSELRNMYRCNKNNVKDDCIAVEQILTFPNTLKVTNKKSKSTKKQSEWDGSNVVGNKNDDSLMTKRKTPRLTKPKRWVTDDLYKFVIQKLEPKYRVKARIRAERFIEFLCDKVFVVNTITEKDLYKKYVDLLMIEMAKLQLIVTYFDFYMFVKQYLPYSFHKKSVPTIMPFNREWMVDPLPPGKLYSSIL